MPELPEVETTLRGIEPWVTGCCVQNVIIRQPQLRWRIPDTFARELTGQTIRKIQRRAKYLIFYVDSGAVLMHLGMSGSLRMAEKASPPEKHDHVDIFMPDRVLRYRDPRRFGAILWRSGNPMHHPLLQRLGPEPLSQVFDGEYLYKHSRNRSVAIKNFIMNGRIVVGVGNIYACEALYRAGIHPKRAASRVGSKRYDKLAYKIKQVLDEAIKAGGTSLRDFVSGAGQPGYFKQKLNVYQRAGEPCPQCGAAIRQCVLGQRSTFYCGECQA